MFLSSCSMASSSSVRSASMVPMSFNTSPAVRPGTLNRYSVTQSYANSFRGDILLDRFNNLSRDEDNILDQIYIKQMCSNFYYEDLKFRE